MKHETTEANFSEYGTFGISKEQFEKIPTSTKAKWKAEQFTNFYNELVKEHSNEIFCMEINTLYRKFKAGKIPKYAKYYAKKFLKDNGITEIRTQEKEGNLYILFAITKTQ